MSHSPAEAGGGSAAGHFHRGNELRAAGRCTEAAEEYRAALARDPRMAEAALNLGFLCEREGNPAAAIEHYRSAASIRPTLTEAHLNLGNVLCKARQFAAAAAAYRCALELQPELPAGWLGLGNARRGQNLLSDAVEAYQHAAVLRPASAEAQVNLANAYRAQNRLPEALAAAERAIALQPDLPPAHINYAMALLVAGRFREAWPHAEYRHAGAAGRAVRTFAQPCWTGEAALAGRTILLHGEQGLGDTLQFARYVELVVARGAKVWVEVQPPLSALLAASLDGVEGVLAHGEPLPEFDLHCPLATLPLAFGTEVATIPARVPYLRVPAERAGPWRELAAPAPRPRIGLAWAGNPAHTNDQNRSMALARLRPVLEALPEARFFGLSRDMSAADVAMLEATPGLTSVGPRFHDFADTAACLAQLDLVLSVDTAVAHLAGALGRPTWILLPYSPDWRWLMDREDSPWYPTARLFRQPATGDWSPVVAQAGAALRARFPRA